MSSYIQLEITGIRKETDDTTVLILKSMNENLISFTPGQFITIFFKGKDREIKRAFSICSTPDDLPCLTIAVKEKDGPTSQFFLKEVEVGNLLKSLPPLGNFTLEKKNNISDHSFFFGAGSGITPLISMIKSQLRTNKNSIVTLIYSNNNEHGIIFKSELDELQDKYKTSFEVIHVLSSPSGEITSYNGRINDQMLSSIFMIYNESELAKADFFVCGPASYMKFVKEHLLGKNIKKEQIHTEDFIAKIVESNDLSNLQKREVTVFAYGKKHIVKVKPGKSIMESANDVGIKLPCKCKEGRCGTCQARLLSGIIKLYSQKVLDQEDMDNDSCLTCVGYPLSEDVVIFYDND